MILMTQGRQGQFVQVRSFRLWTGDPREQDAEQQRGLRGQTGRFVSRRASSDFQEKGLSFLEWELR